MSYDCLIDEYMCAHLRLFIYLLPSFVGQFALVNQSWVWTWLSTILIVDCVSVCCTASRQCPRNFVRCDNGQCIHREEFCEMVTSCIDGSLSDPSQVCCTCKPALVAKKRIPPSVEISLNRTKPATEAGFSPSNLSHLSVIETVKYHKLAFNILCMTQKKTSSITIPESG